MSETKNIIKNFGEIKNAFNEMLVEFVIAKNSEKKDIFKKYVSSIQENEILKNQFLVYTNIENKVEPDINKAILYVKENIDLFSKYSKKDILEANKKLASLISVENHKGENSELYENISALIFTEKTADNLDTIVEATNKIANYIVNNKEKVFTESIDLPNTMLTNIMVDKYNQKYNSLDESEKKIIKVLVESTDDEKKEVYASVIRECIDLINENLEGSDLETKDKLLRVKDRLLNDKQEIDENFIKNISKLAELRNSLK